MRSEIRDEIETRSCQDLNTNNVDEIDNRRCGDDTATSPVSLSDECRQHETPETPDQSACHQDMIPSPSPNLLNPLSSRDVQKSVSFVSRDRKVQGVSLPNLLRRLKQGYQVRHYDESTPEGKWVLLTLDSHHERMQITPIVDEKYQHMVSVKLSSVTLIEPGTSSQASLSSESSHVKEQNCFTVSLRANGTVRSLDFEAMTARDKTLIVSTLLTITPSCCDFGRIGLEVDESERLTTETNCNDAKISDLVIPTLEGSQSGNVKRHIPKIRRSDRDHQETSRAISADLLVGVAPQEWCTDGVCAFAMHDMASAWSDMFCPTEEKALPHRPCGRCSALNASCTCSETKPTHGFINSYSADFLCSQTGMPSLVEDPSWCDETSADGLVQKGKKSFTSNNNLRNRASVLNAQAQHARCLRSETMLSAGWCPAKKMHFIQTTNSLDETVDEGENCVALNSAGSRRKLNDRRKCIDNSMNAQGDRVFYYDSDPEDARLSAHRRGPRNVLAERENSVLVEDKGTSAMTTASMSAMLALMSTEMKDIDESSMEQMLEEIKSETMILLLHHQLTNDLHAKSVQCVKAWIERGSYLNDGTFLQPKLMWRAAFERHLQSRIVPMDHVESVELLDVSRILTLSRVDRKIYPLAKTRRSFVIETSKASLLFEAESISERDRVVFGLKLVVARLASLLMTRDARSIEEFFEPSAVGVPGEAPSWATGK